MKYARTFRLLALTSALVTLAGCPAEGQRPAQPPQGQWAPPGQWTPQGAPPGQTPMAPPVQPTPGQWAPPPPQSQSPFPWWPQGGNIPMPGAGPVPIPALPTIPGMPGGAAQQCVDAINQYRARHSMAPLTRWIAAEPCASAQAQSDAQTGQAHGSFGRCSEGAQNVCPGWRGPPEQMTGPCLQSMYDEGPGADYARHGHHMNMMNPRYTKVACGYFTTAQGQVWAVQDFQ